MGALTRRGLSARSFSAGGPPYGGLCLAAALHLPLVPVTSTTASLQQPVATPDFPPAVNTTSVAATRRFLHSHADRCRPQNHLPTPARSTSGNSGVFSKVYSPVLLSSCSTRLFAGCQVAPAGQGTRRPINWRSSADSGRWSWISA